MGDGRSPRAQSGIANILANAEGEAGSLINPDGVRAAGTVPLDALRSERKGRPVRLAFDPHG